MQTTIKSGMTGAQITRDFGSTTVGDLIEDANILGALGAPEGVVAISGGRTLSSDELVSDYATITLEKRASSKA